jgi:phage-related protein
VVIIGVVGAALYAFKRAVDLNLDGVGDAFHGFTDGVTQTWDALGQLFTQGGFSGALRDEFLKGNNAFVNFAVKIYLIANRVKNFFAGIWDGLTSAVDAIDFSGLTSAFDGLMDLFGGVKNDAGAAGNAFEMFGKAGQIVGGVIGKVAGVVTSVLAAAINVVAGFAKGWDQWVSPALDVASEALGAVYDAIAETVSGLGDALGVGGDTGDLFRTIGMVLANVFGGALKIVSSVVKFAAGNLKALGQVVAGVVKVVVSLFKGDWQGAFDGAKQIVGGLIDYVVGGLGGMVGVVADAIDAIAGLAGVDLGLGKKMADFTAKAKEWTRAKAGLTGDSVATPAGAPPVPGSGAGTPAPAVAAVPPPGVSPEMLFGSVAAMKAVKPQVVVQPLVASVNLDGQRVGELMLKGQQQSAAASFQPMPLSSE